MAMSDLCYNYHGRVVPCISIKLVVEKAHEDKGSFPNVEGKEKNGQLKPNNKF